MSDATTTLDDLKTQVLAFTRERDWEQFHSLKDLAIGLSVEAAEVLEHVRFQSDADLAARLEDESFRREVGHELSDVLYFTLLLHNHLGLDVAESLREKMAINATRYPVDKARGRNVKYTELDG